MLKNINLSEYCDDILVNSAQHFGNMTKVLTATRLKMFLQPPNEVQIDDTSNASAYVLKGLDEIEATITAIESELGKLKVRMVELWNLPELKLRFIPGPSVSIEEESPGVYYYCSGGLAGDAVGRL